MSETIYRVGSKASITSQRGAVSYGPGDILPAKEIYADQPGRLDELMELGMITTKPVVVLKRNGALEVPVVVGQWRVNPADIVGKDLQQLHTMILEIDASLLKDLPETVEEAREFLSIDYHPEPDTD